MTESRDPGPPPRAWQPAPPPPQGGMNQPQGGMNQGGMNQPQGGMDQRPMPPAPQQYQPQQYFPQQDHEPYREQPQQDTAAPSPTQPPPGFDDRGRVRRTKVSGVWIGLIAAVVVLVLLIIFIAQNLNNATLHFLGFSGKVSLGLAMLVAALSGVVIAVVPGTVRIFQLRKALQANADTEGLRHPGRKK